MSILSDKQIRARSMVPTHRYRTPSYGQMWFAFEHATGNLYNVGTGERFAAGEEHTWLENKDFVKLTENEQAGYCLKYPRMIAPFEPVLVRTKKVIDRPGGGFPEVSHMEKVISYGTSSYGYDVRCADEFKVFTNINSTVVDPKNFDEKNFVTFKGESCIIPPNSFALARTVERFHIPRDILTVCLGKSTYARCFTGDTRVSLADGSSATFVELVERADRGERFWGYSVSEQGHIEIAELTAPRLVGHERVLEVELDNGQVIRCTPDHKFMTRVGEYVEAQHLRPDDSLMPLYRGEYRGYESVYQPADGRMISTHWMADLWNNHKVVAVREVEGTHDVYCLTVPEFGNFALESGVFVKNCGIIVNVTPFEPEWEGYVTLEFSNTTPLPAKIYANEGVAQVLFFRADDVCETSYADRGGKYQGQAAEVVCPKV